MNEIIVVIAILLVTALTTMNGFAAPLAQPDVDVRMFREGGDILDDEILIWNRLRAERQVMLPLDDSAPVVGSDSDGRVYAVTASGKLLTSDDGGKTFSEPAQLTVDGDPLSVVSAFGVLKSGKLLATYDNDGKLSVAVSADRGGKWQRSGGVDAPAGQKLSAQPGTRMVELADGTVLLPVQQSGDDGDVLAAIYGSQDEGRTWSVVGTLGPRCRSANLLQLRSGELLAAITYRGPRQRGDGGDGIDREEIFHNVVVARSGDGGRTWNDARGVTRYKEAPADLVELPDGTVVLTYGQQTAPFGARAVVSRDGGRTWSDKFYILGYSTVWAPWYSGAMFPAAPGWQVSSTAVADGTILTLYTRGSYVLRENQVQTSWYKANKKSGEKAMGVMAVRWTLKGMDKPPLSYPGVYADTNEEGYLDNNRYLVRPQDMYEGGDYFHDEEILLCERDAAERHRVGEGGGPIVRLDPEGHPVVCNTQGAIYRSTDVGRTWEKISQVPTFQTKDESLPGPARIHFQAFGILSDGTMLAQFVDGAIIRSEDGGKTWGDPIALDHRPFEFMGHDNCMKIMQMPDGTVITNTGALFPRKPGYMGIIWEGIYRSRDGGKTWGDFSYLVTRGSETNVLRLKSGRMIVAIRYQGPHLSDDFILDTLDTVKYRNTFIKNSAIAFSDDNGYTWSNPKVITRFFECPADVVEMNDGTIAVSYQQKNCPTGARGLVSYDGGKTFEDEVYMIDWVLKGGGHTSSVLLPDGRIMTVSVTPDLQATIWKPRAK